MSAVEFGRAGAAGVAPSAHDPLAAGGDRGARPRVVVVGGGIAGLAAAHALARGGADVRLFERAACVGGVIASVRDGAYLVEEGPNTVVRTPALARLVAELGLEREVSPVGEAAARRYVVRDGRPHAVPTSPAAFVRTPLLSARGKLRLLAEPLVPRGGRAGESVADLARRRLGDEAARWLVDAIVGGIYAGDTAALDAAAAFPALAGWERAHGSLVRGGLAAMRAARRARAAAARAGETPALDAAARRAARAPLSFRGGLATLTRAIAAGLGGRVTCGAAVRAVGRAAAGWRVAVETAAGRTAVEADAVVVAVPAWALGAIDWPTAVGPLAAAAGAVPHAPVATLTLAFRRDQVAHPLDGFGALVPPAAGRDLLGVLFASTLQPDRCPAGEVLLSCFVGGAHRPELAALDRASAESLVRRELRDLLGVRGAPTYVRHRAWSPGIPQYTADQPRAAAAADALERECPRLRLIGGWRGGVALGACAAAGLATADQVLAGARHAG